MTLSFRRLFLSSLTLWIAVAIAGGFFLYNLKNFVKFGIDLVGGTYITLEVQLDKAREMELVERMYEIEEILKKNKKPIPPDRQVKDETIVMKFETEKDAGSSATFLMGYFKQMLIDHDGQFIKFKLTQEQIKKVNEEAIESNVIALNTRVDQFGVGETLVAKIGENRIVVELPNVHNLREAKEIIGRAALLEIKKVEDVAQSEDELLDRYDRELPEGTVMVPSKPGSRQEFFLLPAYTDITGKLLRTAFVASGGQTGLEPVVGFEFKPTGAKRFYELTRKNVGQRIAVVIDDVVICAPRVDEAISSSGSIRGDFTQQEAKQLAILLRSGAFVAPVTFEEERHIGPSLGAESIKNGLIACLVSLVLLFIFSLVIYKVAGLLTFIVLLFNLLFILFALWMIGATLTLPGIAGMILTVGMAIDASILIYERIKEELRGGATLREAVKKGFSGATTVILDANITHLLIAIVLYKLGSGPIQGFAVTMIVGIIGTLLTALLLLKSFFNFAINKLSINKISI